MAASSSVAVVPPPAVPAVVAPPDSSDVEELFRARAFALLSEPEVLDAIRRDLTGKAAAPRQKMLLGLVQALKREGKGGGAPSNFNLIVSVPRPERA